MVGRNAATSRASSIFGSKNFHTRRSKFDRDSPDGAGSVGF